MLLIIDLTFEPYLMKGFESLFTGLRRISQFLNNFKAKLSEKKKEIYNKNFKKWFCEFEIVVMFLSVDSFSCQKDVCVRGDKTERTVQKGPGTVDCSDRDISEKKSFLKMCCANKAYTLFINEFLKSKKCFFPPNGNDHSPHIPS